MATKRETTMSAGEGPSGSGVNPMPETRVLNWILSGFDEGPSSGKEERAGEGATKWARRLPHICEHTCLATTKRGRWSGEGVEELLSDYTSLPFYLFYRWSLSLSLSLINLVPMMMSSVLVMILYQVLRQISSELNSAFTCHSAMNPRIIFNFIYNFPMIITVPMLLQILRQISSELTMLFLYHV
jgi:hypothetical protein